MSWVQPYNAKGWVVELHQIPRAEGTSDFPQDWNDQAALGQYFTGVLVVPTVLCGIGILIAVACACRLCCCHKYSRLEQRPRSCRLFFLAGITTTAAALGLAASVGAVKNGTVIVQEQLDSLAADADSAVSIGHSLTINGKTLDTNFDTIRSTCQDQPGWPMIQDQLKKDQQQVKDLLATISSYQEQVDPLPNDIRNAKEQVTVWVPLLGLILAVPLMLVLATLVFNWLGLTVTRFWGRGNECGRCCGDALALRITAFLALIAIIALSVAWFAELGTAILTADFCVAPNNNTANLALSVSQGNTSASTYVYVEYYIQGVGSSPMEVKLNDATQDLSQLKTEIGKHEQDLKKACPPLSPEVSKSMNSAIAVCQQNVQDAQTLVAPQRIYTYFNSGVQAACSYYVPGIGWLFIVEFVLVIPLLPALLLSANSYYKKLVAFQTTDREPLMAGNVELGASANELHVAQPGVHSAQAMQVEDQDSSRRNSRVQFV
mmetsp:Transcript_21228/g.48260  ORF Transcript_21228/g.48260 Transcript_21228/m.48260 type:complete len:490 (-) Transcript_21228:42-1511(-)|eukprot:CAMPEP_0204354758 /NCGR_PEP_ID=MMETSP0469-20131031/33632_1 /ASSEMBLY_ACC=CAM_ASM_000384 /TAXON_ID=2969 /ORGANISM="Oxyrrhis marina" /LENGTH=489 /DNA_ID=CAMNT_0051341903 /DNA_START=10 /DNA_END=1479 /DNA_ORIENTATION=-